ncbi:tetratricopeptide repeat protein [Actinoplanes sp. GCM10030250]|uniref:tetratricopeptide repeat protein n=1 Tax=Actinoplanes sp. GCM10030250 TaxID=3273376 RepID=UPI00360C5C0B
MPPHTLSGRPAEPLTGPLTGPTAGPTAGPPAGPPAGPTAEPLNEALAEAREAVRLEPAHQPAHRVLARALAARRDFDSAREAARRALSLDPASIPDLLNLAEIERQAGHRSAAREAVRAALARDPDNPDGRWLIALLDAERLRVGPAMRGLRRLAAEHPAQLAGAAMTWPIRGLLGGLRRGLTAGVLLTAILAATALPWPSTLILARAASLTVAAVMILLSALVLIPAGRLPWRCLTLLPPRMRRAVLTGLVAAAATVTLLLTYALSPRWQSLPLAAAALLALLAAGRADRVPAAR